MPPLQPYVDPLRIDINLGMQVRDRLRLPAQPWAPEAHSLLEGHAKGRRPSCPYVKSGVRLGDSASQRYAP